MITQSIATELAKDEYNHVVFLRTALGAAAVPIPLVLLLARLAGGPCHAVRHARMAAAGRSRFGANPDSESASACYGRCHSCMMMLTPSVRSVAEPMTCSRCLCPHLSCKRMRTQLNIGTGTNGSFSIFAAKADSLVLYPPFDPSGNNLFFLLGIHLRRRWRHCLPGANAVELLVIIGLTLDRAPLSRHPASCSVVPQRLVACCRSVTLHSHPKLGTKFRNVSLHVMW